MGNPGITEPFNYCTLNMYSNASFVMDSIMPTSVVTDYREYVLQMLPNLQYLDGIGRNTLVTVIGVIPSSPTSSMGNGSSSQGQPSNGSRKISPTLSFKDIFRLKRRKKSYPSSSTN